MGTGPLGEGVLQVSGKAVLVPNEAQCTTDIMLAETETGMFALLTS